MRANSVCWQACIFCLITICCRRHFHVLRKLPGKVHQAPAPQCLQASCQLNVKASTVSTFHTRAITCIQIIQACLMPESTIPDRYRLPFHLRIFCKRALDWVQDLFITRCKPTLRGCQIFTEMRLSSRIPSIFWYKKPLSNSFKRLYGYKGTDL